MYQDDCRLKGVVNLVLRDKDGKVKQHKTIRNKVTRAGIAHIIGRMIDDGQEIGGGHKMPRMMSHMAVGIGAAARGDRDKYNAVDFDDPLPQSGSPKDAANATATVRQERRQQLQNDRMFKMKEVSSSVDERYYKNQMSIL